MKFNDAGDFCMLYIEPADEKPALLEFISGQKKPVVIMLSGFGDELDTAEGPPPGVDFVVGKPVTLEKLRDVLAMAVEPGD